MLLENRQHLHRRLVLDRAVRGSRLLILTYYQYCYLFSEFFEVLLIVNSVHYLFFLRITNIFIAQLYK